MKCGRCFYQSDIIHPLVKFSRCRRSTFSVSGCSQLKFPSRSVGVEIRLSAKPQQAVRGHHMQLDASSVGGVSQLHIMEPTSALIAPSNGM